VREGSGNGASLSAGALLVEPEGGGGGFVAGDPEGYGEDGSGDGHLSPWGLRCGAWQGACLPGPYVKLWRLTSLSLGTSLGRRGEGFRSLGTLRVDGGLRKRSVSLFGRSVMGTCGGSFTGDPEGYVAEGCGDRHFFP
jgi:hypothetical protein